VTLGYAYLRNEDRKDEEISTICGIIYKCMMVDGSWRDNIIYIFVNYGFEDLSLSLSLSNHTSKLVQMLVLLIMPMRPKLIIGHVVVEQPSLLLHLSGYINGYYRELSVTLIDPI
jgi:hypothetical protein